MKGLLLKDWYMIKKYCRSYVVIAAIFIAVSLVSDDNMFFVFYPCLLCGMIPVNLLGYDERSHWVQYSCSLPYTKEQIVSTKYLIGLLAQITVLIVTAAVQGIKMRINGSFELNDFIVLMLLMLTMATLTSSISLPFIFKLGVEKGRIAYFVMIGFVGCGSVFAAGLFRGHFKSDIQLNALLIVLALVGVGVYILSWYLSVVFYKKREI